MPAELNAKLLQTAANLHVQWQGQCFGALCGWPVQGSLPVSLQGSHPCNPLSCTSLNEGALVCTAAGSAI